MIFMSGLFSLLFLGGWSWWGTNLTLMLALKTSLISMFFMWMSASFPSMSYDQLMSLLWKSYLPLSLGALTITMSMLWAFGGLPPI